MRIPYLQLDERFLTTEAPVISALTGLDVDSVIGKAVRLFAFIIDSTSTKETPPDGILIDPDAPAIIEGVMGWTGERGRLAAAFVRADTIERLEVGLRVRGCDRYKATWEKNRRRPKPGRPETVRKPSGNRTEPVRLSAGTVPKPGRETETETETDPHLARTPPRAASESKSTQVETEPASSDADAFVLGLAKAWEEAQPAVQPVVPDGGTLRAFQRDSGAPVPVLLAAYRLFLADPYWHREGWPWSGWAKQSRKFIARATAPPPPAVPQRGKSLPPVRAEDVDWSKQETGISDGF